jgi:hypothetical protein
VDIYFSADVETDGPIPGRYSMLSFALVYAGRSDGCRFEQPSSYSTAYEATLRPIFDAFQPEALAVNGLDRERLAVEGKEPAVALAEAADWIARQSQGGTPVLVAYPVSFDWTWLYWYLMSEHSRRVNSPRAWGTHPLDGGRRVLHTMASCLARVRSAFSCRTPA